MSVEPDPAEVPCVWNASARDAATRNIAADPRVEVDAVEAMIREQMRHTVPTVVTDRHGDVAVRDVRWRSIYVYMIYPNATYPNADPPRLSVWVEAQAPDDRPPPQVSGYVVTPLRFTLFWEFLLDGGPGAPWRVESARAAAIDGLGQETFTLRRETEDEFRVRTGAGPGGSVTPTPRSRPPYRYRLVCDFADHDLRIGGTVAIELERETAPTSAEAELCVTPAMEADVRAQTSETDVRPTVSHLACVELLDGP